MIKKTELKLTEYESGVLERHIEDKQFINNGKTTVVILTMKNGFDVTGESSCVHRDMFDVEIGRHYALIDALRKVDRFIGFGRQQESYELTQKSFQPKDSPLPEVEVKVTYEDLREALDNAGDAMKGHGEIVGGHIRSVGRFNLDELGASVENAVFKQQGIYSGGIVSADKLVSLSKDEFIISNKPTKEMMKQLKIKGVGR